MEPPDDLPESDFISSLPGDAPSSSKLKQSILSTHLVQPDSYLAQLSPIQREAVTASIVGGLAILACPGAGKTAVLTKRVAWMVQDQKINPEQLV